MTKEKQIEEMAKQLYGNFGLTMTTARNVAKYLTEKKGYRRADEVAEEIFAEIEDVINNIGYFDELDFNALKKKYTESEKDDG